MKWTDILQIALAILQAASAMVVACFTAFLAKVARSTLKVTQITAQAARKSAEVAEKSVNDVERPYVLVENIDPRVKVFGQPGAVPYVVLSLRNYGRSPALIRQLRALLEISPHAKPVLQNWPLVKAIPLPTITVIGANQCWEYACYHDRRIDDGEAQQIESGTLYSWCYLTVFYDDMLRQHYEMRMRFRYDTKDNMFSVLQGDEYVISEKGSTP